MTLYCAESNAPVLEMNDQMIELYGRLVASTTGAHVTGIVSGEAFGFDFRVYGY